MAKPQPKQQVRKPTVQYLNVDLTKAYKEDLLKWLENGVDLFDCIEKAIDTGLRFGCSIDVYNDCIQAQLTKLPTPGSDELTLVLVGRGGNLAQAIQALFFKYHVILNGELVDLDRKNGRGQTDWA